MSESAGSHPTPAPVTYAASLRIPDHHLIRKIGGGSYGEVWLARNVLGQSRAVKIVHRSTFEDDRPFEREFEGIRRFEPISRSHPSQLNILHVGRDEGYFYYVMELADGAESRSEDGGLKIENSNARTASCHPQSSILDPQRYLPRTLKLDLKRRGRLPPAECVEIGLALTTALAHLHAHSLIHRDIKPSNIIFVGGVPKLADIGLVTDVDASRSFVGTEGFLPPEGPGTPQADLYSLGKVLYEMSTGRDRKDYPLLPQDWDALDPAEQSRLLELNEVLVKVCEADARRRYQTAEQLRADLALLQRGKSVKRERTRERRAAFATRIAFATVCLGIISLLGYSLMKRATMGKTQILAVQTEQRPGTNPRTNSEAYKLFEQAQAARRKGTKDGFAEAIDFYNRAIALEPKWAHAHACKAYTYQEFSEWHLPPRQAMTEARAAATHALELTETDANAHVVLGLVKLFYDWDWLGAETEFKRAVTLNPAIHATHANYATYLRAAGRLDDARVELELASRLSPKSIYVYSGWVQQFIRERQYTKALEQCDEAQQSHPRHALPRILRGNVHMRQRSYQAAIKEFEAARALDDAPDVMATLGFLFGKGDRKNDALELLGALESMSRTRYVGPQFKAAIYAGLGEKERALACYQQACADQSSFLVAAAGLGIDTDPQFEDLRTDSRFHALLKKVGLEK